MALEKSLWQRVRKGALSLRKLGHGTHMCRIENGAGDGNPDVEGCIDGKLFCIELKSEMRPKRIGTPLRFKTRESQAIWHHDRTVAGSRHHWVLAQVGEANDAQLYLVPGSQYDLIVCTEDDLNLLSVTASDAAVADVLLRAAGGF